MTSLGLYFYLQQSQPEITAHLPWLPLTASIPFIVTYNTAWAPVPFLMMAELLPVQIKAVCGTLTMIVLFISSFVMVKYSATLEASTILGYAGLFWLYAVVNLWNAVFTYFFVPETKGKTLEDIERFYEVRENVELPKITIRQAI